jgi:hypothetical protein
MLDIDDSRGRDRDSLACHLDLKSLALFDAIRKPSYFLDELFHWVVLLDVMLVPSLLMCHRSSPISIFKNKKDQRL